jgi:WD40 repeat protein
MYTINSLQLLGGTGLFATASRDKSIRIWDNETYELKKVISPEKGAGHSHSVNCLLYFGANNYLVSGSDDRKLIAWQLTETEL